MNEVLILISQPGSSTTPIGDLVQGSTRRTVFAARKSVGATYKLQALAVGLRPKYRFILADYLEYQGETLVEYEGDQYRVIDTYRGEDNTLELTVEDTP